jgi:hypothetical protein
MCVLACSCMAAKSKEFASLRLPISLRRKVTAIAKAQRWTLSQTLRVLVEESVDRREVNPNVAHFAMPHTLEAVEGDF